MKKEAQKVQVEVSWESLFRLLAFVVGIWAIITLKEVLIMLFGVFVFVAAVNTTVTRWQKHMSRLLAVSLYYVLLLAGVVVIGSVIMPTLVHQLRELATSLPDIIDRLRPQLSGSEGGSVNSFVDQGIATVQNGLEGLSQGLLQTTITFVGGVATVLTGVVISFYLLLEETNAREFFHQVLPHNRFEAVYKTVSKIADRMGAWVRGQILLMAIIGFSNLVIYLLLGLHSPLPLAVWAGLCEAIPFVGPALGVIPALAIALATGSVLQAVLVVALGFVLIQQFEAHIVVPKVMGRAVGLSPVLVILALVVGAKLLGFVGAIIAIPVAAIISVIIGEWPSLRKLWETEE